MSKKDRVIQATDQVTEALQALIRIDYANDKQASNNAFQARVRLSRAIDLLLEV